MFDGLFQPTHLILVLAIALIVFGPGKLPELGKAIGQSIREFKKALNEATSATTEVPKLTAAEQQPQEKPGQQTVRS
jgi:sec-independent protein translocase protein TatA